MAQGMSLHIGINRVDPGHYQGWDGELKACEFDAKDMTKIATAKKLSTNQLLTANATSSNMIQAMRDASRKLKTGDIFFLTYSGHGGQVPDTNGDDEDGKDETWVLYDRQLVDDELYSLFGQFEPGVRIFMLSDSCHSGTVARAVYENLSTALSTGGLRSFRENSTFTTGVGPRFRTVPEDILQKTYNKNKKLYDDIQHYSPDGDKLTVGASVILISGCKDNQYSSDGDKNGLFTETFLKVWNKGTFNSYKSLYSQISKQMTPWQSPNYFKVGAPNLTFERQKPLAV